MNLRLHSSLGTALAALALAALTPGAGLAQTEAETARLPWGAPDLQGVWDFRTITPLQRPEDQADKAFLSDEEAASLEQAAADRVAQLAAPSEVRTEPLPPGGGGAAVGAYNNFWFDTGTNVIQDRRTSLIVDPPNGRMPPLVAGAPEQIGSGTEDLPSERPVRYRAGGIGADGPEDRGLGERCILGFNSGPPMIPSAYNNNMQLFQTESHVVILNEMVHDARIVPLDGRPHLPGGVRQWMGDARGYWEGDSLVVETTNFTGMTPSFNPTITSSVGTGTSLTLVERFSRLDNDTLLYEYTVDDPATFTSPFSAAIPMRLSDRLIYEYACHEGNYGLHNILAGARAAERVGAGGGQ